MFQSSPLRAVNILMRKGMGQTADGPYRGFGYLSLFSDHIDLATCYSYFATFYRVVNTKTSIIQMY